MILSLQTKRFFITIAVVAGALSGSAAAAADTGQLLSADRVVLAEMAEAESSAAEVAAPASAAEVLAGTLERFPLEPVSLRGQLIVRRQRGVILRQVPFSMELEWGAPEPRASYRLYDNFQRLQAGLVITRRADGSRELQWLGDGTERPAVAPVLTDLVEGTDIAWLDLTLDYLWWPEARLAGEASFRGTLCDLVEVTPPQPLPGCSAVRLWIDRRLRVLRQAEQLDAAGVSVRRMWVSSVGKIDKRWMIRNMEIERPHTGVRTKLQVEELAAAE